MAGAALVVTLLLSAQLLEQSVVVGGHPYRDDSSCVEPVQSELLRGDGAAGGRHTEEWAFVCAGVDEVSGQPAAVESRWRRSQW